MLQVPSHGVRYHRNVDSNKIRMGQTYLGRGSRTRPDWSRAFNRYGNPLRHCNQFDKTISFGIDLSHCLKRSWVSMEAYRWCYDIYRCTSVGIHSFGVIPMRVCILLLCLL